MFSPFHVIEIILFSLMQFGPYLLLSLLTFRKRLRFSITVTTFICSGIFIVQFLTRYWSATQDIYGSLSMSLLRLILFMSAYILLFQVDFRKIIFIELIFANIGNFIILVSVYLERTFFPFLHHHLYCWHSTLAILLLHLIFTLPIAYMIKVYFIPMLKNDANRPEWNYYWAVPAIFYLTWQFLLNGGPVKGLDVIMHTANMLFLFAVNLVAFWIYLLMLRLDGQLAINLELMQAAHYHDIETLKYQLLEERIMDARRARHDVRHHMIIMSELLDCGDYESLRDYFEEYLQTLPDIQAIQLCSNQPINSVLLYYAHRAKEYEIDFQTHIHVPEHISVRNVHISVLLGNLLENAIDSCIESKGNKQIIIRAMGTPHSLSFTIDNTCTTPTEVNKKGEFLTTKKKGSGLGMKSARHIVEQYNGVLSAERKDDMFYVSFMLNL